MRNKTFQFRSRGKMLSAQKWWPKKDYPRAVVIFIHSWADYSGRYSEVAQHLAVGGYASYSFDFEGHGDSEGYRGHIADFQHWVADLTTFVATVQSELRSVPVFLCGYGVGGCVAAHYITSDHHDVDGVIFNASALEVGKDISSFKVMIAWLIGGLIPKLPISSLPPNQISSVLTEQRAYDEDEKVYHGKMTAGTGKELLLASMHISKQLAKIEAPLLVLQGTGDMLVSPEGGTAVYHQARSIDKSLQIYDDARHDLFHEQQKSTVFEHVKSWLDARTKVSW
jgi:alpha-beta hydrolase superfamily lysophospholipase